jgi:4-amino-4-deoxy-L-arabinose transferase-like glycosyltransferase
MVQVPSVTHRFELTSPHLTVMRLATSPAVLLFLLGALFRLAYLFIFLPPFESVYWNLSSSLVHSRSFSLNGISAADYEPLYPMFLTLIRFLAGDWDLAVQAGQALVASLGGIYVYLLARAITDREATSVIAASLYAVDPLLVRQAAQASDLALVTLLLVAFAYYFVAATRMVHMGRAGIVLGLVILTRTMMLPLVLLGAAVLVVHQRVRGALVFTATVVILVLPLVVRSRVVNGSWAPTRSGLNLYIGNSPFTAAVVPDYDVDILQEQAAAQIHAELLDVPDTSPKYSSAASALLTKHAVDYMTKNAMDNLRQKALTILYFFSPRLLPFYIAGPDTRAIYRGGQVVVVNAYARPAIEPIAYSVFYTPVLLAAACGVYLSRGNLSRAAILWCIVATVVAVHSLYFPATRYRAPMEFVLLLYASVALDRLVERSFMSRCLSAAGKEA